MAGRGTPPKDPSTRARRNVDPHVMRVVESLPASPPPFPEAMPSGDPWPQRTLDWWQTWVDDPLTDEFRGTDWSELLDTAILHGLLWLGDPKVAGEIRLRVAKHGATAEDRARLRITFAQADAADESRGTRQSSKTRHEGLRLAE